MSYHIYPSQSSFSNETQDTEFTVQVTTLVPLPDGGSLGAPNASSVIEIVPSSVTARSIFIFNKGPGTIHLHLGTPSTSWESSPESARQIKPGGYAESTPESSKASLSGWSEGDTANLLVDIFS